MHCYGKLQTHCRLPSINASGTDSHDRKLSVICIPAWFCESRLHVRLVQIFIAVLAMLLGTAVNYLYFAPAVIQPDEFMQC